MVNDIQLLDKINLQKYIYLISCFLSNKISADVFVEYFLRIRRGDTYWLSSLFDTKINHILDSIFLDIDEYNPDELYNPDDKFNINENELRKRLSDKLLTLNNFTL